MRLDLEEYTAIVPLFLCNSFLHDLTPRFLSLCVSLCTAQLTSHRIIALLLSPPCQETQLSNLTKRNPCSSSRSLAPSVSYSICPPEMMSVSLLCFTACFSVFPYLCRFSCLYPVHFFQQFHCVLFFVCFRIAQFSL